MPETVARPGVTVVGHFPPPLHGMSYATERFAAVLDSRASVRRLVISGDRHGRSLSHHAVRMARTLGAAARLGRSRRGERVYVACDAGPGMAYVALVLATARLRGMPRWLHHHSYAYLTRRSRLMAALVRVAGRKTVHVFTCARQAESFAALYRGAPERRTLPITYTLDEPAAPATGAGWGDRTVVLGHLSNLSMAKGLGTVIATLDACLRRGIDAVVHLAGPVVDPAAADALAEAEARLGPRVVHRGPVFGKDKDEYLAGLDVFLFPSRYRNESFGIVAAEAMAAGVPVVALEVGCLDAAWVAGGGLVLGPDDDYVEAAVRQIETWLHDTEAYEQARQAAFHRAREGWQAGCDGADRLADAIAGVAP